MIASHIGIPYLQWRNHGKGEKMLTSNGYSLTYDRSHNRIVIGLPQTWGTLTNTLEPVVDRGIDIEEKDLAILLNATQFIFLNGTSTWRERTKDA